MPDVRFPCRSALVVLALYNGCSSSPSAPTYQDCTIEGIYESEGYLQELVFDAEGRLERATIDAAYLSAFQLQGAETWTERYTYGDGDLPASVDGELSTADWSQTYVLTYAYSETAPDRLVSADLQTSDATCPVGTLCVAPYHVDYHYSDDGKVLTADVAYADGPELSFTFEAYDFPFSPTNPVSARGLSAPFPYLLKSYGGSSFEYAFNADGLIETISYDGNGDGVADWTHTFTYDEASNIVRISEGDNGAWTFSGSCME